MTTAETMESLTSDFFAGVPHVDWEDSTDVPPNSLNSIGTTVLMASSVLDYADPYAYDLQTEDILNKLDHIKVAIKAPRSDDVLTFIAAEAEDILDTLNTPIFQDRPLSCLKDPVSCSDHAQTDHLGQEYSCDPSPFAERDVDIAAAALAAAQAVHSAATAVNNMRLMLIKRAHDFHLAALAAAEDDDFDAHRASWHSPGC
jgi:hypothetical protein